MPIALSRRGIDSTSYACHLGAGTMEIVRVFLTVPEAEPSQVWGLESLYFGRLDFFPGMSPKQQPALSRASALAFPSRHNLCAFAPS
jgi:hypothetical protein